MPAEFEAMDALGFVEGITNLLFCILLRPICTTNLTQSGRNTLHHMLREGNACNVCMQVQMQFCIASPQSRVSNLQIPFTSASYWRKLSTKVASPFHSEFHHENRNWLSEATLNDVLRKHRVASTTPQHCPAQQPTSCILQNVTLVTTPLYSMCHHTCALGFKVGKQ